MYRVLFTVPFLVSFVAVNYVPVWVGAIVFLAFQFVVFAVLVALESRLGD